MRAHGWTALGAAAAILVSTAGCDWFTRPEPEPIPLRQVVDAFDTNCARVDALTGRVGVWLRAPKKTLFVPFDGRVAFSRPNFLHLEITKFGRWVFDVGTNADEYWFWSREAVLDDQPNVLRRGSMSKLDEGAARGLILPPDAVADALGVSPLLPRPGSRTAVLPEQYDAGYVINYVRILDRRLRLTRKAYLDRFTGRLTRIDYFAPDGRRVLFITYDAWRTTGDVTLPKRVTLHIPDADAAVRFDLGRLKLKPPLPAEIFQRPTPPGAAVIDLDKAD